VASARKRSRTPARRTPEQAGSGRKRDFTNPKLLITAGVILLIGVLAFFPVALATDQAAFCKSCHGMVPFYDAWAQGQHASHATCIDCHVDAGYPARFAHKFVALGEVYAQLFSNSKYPNYNAEVPNRRCLRCHPDIPTKTIGQFKHADHLTQGVPCAKCHATTGHKVSFASLDAAGVLNTANAPAGQEFVGQNPADTGGKGSAYPSHRAVPCQSCHDQANLQCSFCHAAPAGHFGPDCRACHSNAAVPFKQFTHPSAGEHDWRRKKCVKCHPNGYATVYCTCHKGHPPTGD
jgi:nitrate/TMAO reductase-like tetraheme cytochrome c subunit